MIRFPTIPTSTTNRQMSLKTRAVSGQVDLNLGWADLTSITAIRNQDSATNGDVDFTSAQLVYIQQ